MNDRLKKLEETLEYIKQIAEQDLGLCPFERKLILLSIEKVLNPELLESEE